MLANTEKTFDVMGFFEWTLNPIFDLIGLVIILF
jgi:hypothetical protein